MENKLSDDYYGVVVARPGTGRVQEMMGRHPPKRGNIKREIFASMAASILHALKKIGTTWVKIIRYAMPASACKICCPGKATSTPLHWIYWESCGHELETRMVLEVYRAYREGRA